MSKVAMTDGDDGALLISADGELVATIDASGTLLLDEMKAATPAGLLAVARALAAAANVARQRAGDEHRTKREDAIAQLKEQVDPELLQAAGLD